MNNKEFLRAVDNIVKEKILIKVLFMMLCNKH